MKALNVEKIKLGKTIEIDTGGNFSKLRLQSELVIAKNVNDILTNEIDDLQQCQRRQCLVIDGYQATPNETISQVTQKAENALAQHLQLDPDEVVN